MDHSLSLYKIFNTVAEVGNISKAGKVLFISQPAISKSITKLELSLCVKLFVRSSRGVVLTDEGKLLYEHTSKAFESIVSAENQLKRMNDLGMGEIRIGASTTLCKYILLPLLSDFIERFPHVKITIDCQPTLQTIPLLDSNRIDVGLIVDSNLTKHFKLYGAGEIEDIFVATRSYMTNLKERESSDDLDIFASANLMLLDKENITRQLMDVYFANEGIEINNLLEITNMDLLIDFAKIGLGVAGVIREFVEDDLVSGALIEIPLMIPIPKRTVCFAHPVNAVLSPAANLFIDFISERLF